MIKIIKKQTYDELIRIKEEYANIILRNRDLQATIVNLQILLSECSIELEKQKSKNENSFKKLKEDMDTLKPKEKKIKKK